jgi:hypothetical protein
MPKPAVKSIPFPNLPLPSKFTKITKTKSAHAPEPSPEPTPEPTPKCTPKPKVERKQRKVGEININEPQVGGILEPEPEKKQDKGDHVIEELDYDDYDS